MAGRLIVACAIAALLNSSGANAASLEFNPVRVEMHPGQTATTIELHNFGAKVAVQIRPFQWTQQGDADELKPTGDLLVSPPIFTIPEGGTQVVRLLVRSAGGGTERTFRLLFDELPGPGSGNRMVTALRASIPVFYAPLGMTPEHLEWTAAQGPGGLLLAVHNTGGQSARLKLSADLPGGRGSALMAIGKDPNVLSGATRHWLLHDTGGIRPGSVLTFHVASSAGTREETVTVPR